MNIVDEMIDYADALYRYAYQKTHDTNEAHDLVQETYLSVLLAINNGKAIKNLKSYLFQILNHKFYDSLRKKYVKNTVVHNICQSYAIKPEQLEYQNTDEDTEKSEILKKIMRELAYLSKIYRDVMVLYYMESKSINEIATSLGLSKGTVLSRLDMGRKKIKEGVNRMNIHTYKPENLTITMWGYMGLNNEPYNVITNLIEQNLLILAHEKPLTMEEICEETGIPAVYVEEFIDKLVKHEFMKRIGNKVFTNFFIVEDEIINSKRAVQTDFVNTTFNDVKSIFTDLLCEYKKTGILHKFNDTQLVLYGFLSIFLHLRFYLIDALKLIKVDDYPDRPNGGKWIIYSGHKIDNEAEKPLQSVHIAGECYTDDDHVIKYEEWNTALGITIDSDNDLKIHPCDNLLLLYNIHKGIEIDPIKLKLIPHLLKLGLLSNSKENKKTVNIPIISDSDYKIIRNLNLKYYNKFVTTIGDSLIKMIKKNALKCPKHITPVSPCTHLILVDGLPLLYLQKAAELGLINIDKDKNYPISLIIENSM
jgi:RNA polymerase sigma-70 factor (ECF subfamily)